MSKSNILKSFMNEIWNSQKQESVDFYLHDQYTIHLDNQDPWEGKTLSKSEFIERLQYSFNSFPDINFEITNVIEDGDNVACTWILTGTNSGKIADFPPTHKKIRTEGMSIYHFTGEKLSGHTQVFDRTKVMQQLGFI